MNKTDEKLTQVTNLQFSIERADGTAETEDFGSFESEEELVKTFVNWYKGHTGISIPTRFNYIEEVNLFLTNNKSPHYKDGDMARILARRITVTVSKAKELLEKTRAKDHKPIHTKWIPE